MASKRKKKKQAKRAAAVNGNQTHPSTSMSDAMDKAQEEKKSKPEPKIIKGFGMKTDGSVIHAVTNIDQSALCDIRTKDISISDDLTAKDVTCRKCQSYAIFKQALSTTTGHEPAEKAVAKAEEDSKKSKDVKVKKGDAEEKKEEEKKEDIPEDTAISDDDIDGIMETVKVLLNQKLKKVEKRLVKKLEKYCEKIMDVRPVFFIARKANNMYQIIHDPSRYVICDNVKESDAEVLLQKYLGIETKWDGQTKPSSQWLTALRKIHEEHFGKDVQKEKRVLKRRKPKPSLKRRKDRKPVIRKIKRRQK